MDKRNTIIGLLLLAAAFGMMVFQGKQFDLTDHHQPETSFSEAQPTETSEDFISHPTQTTQKTSIFEAISEPKIHQKTASEFKENFYTLENEFVSVKFTTKGGAIKNVALKKYQETLDSEEPFLFNGQVNSPALTIAFKGQNNLPHSYEPEFKLVNQSEETILFSARTAEGVEIFRGYSIEKDNHQRDPYLIIHETKFVNHSNLGFNLKDLYISMGSIPPTRGDTFGEYLNVGYYNQKDDDFIKVKDFHASKGFLGFGKHDAKQFIEKDVKNLVWASVKNQFFTCVLTPNDPASGVFARPITMDKHLEDPELNEGIEGSMKFSLGQIQPGQTKLVSMEFYVGPKEFKRLESLGQNQDLVMQFGFFGIISKLLLIIMTGVNSFIPNWGLTIIVVTILIKLVLWPLTAMQVRSSKRMQLIQAPLKEIKEKYKGNPQKIQLETMKLFKEHRVNPAAGCLPLFVQLPIFLGLYFMLRSASELRFASFLWIKDLSVPDTIAFISGFPVNILPLLMAVSMFFQMRLMPSPMTDNMQKKIFQFMPFIFLIFCYNFPAGLVLYWTVQNVLTIVQQSISSRMKDPVEVIPVTDPKKSLKNKGKLSNKKNNKFN